MSDRDATSSVKERNERARTELFSTQDDPDNLRQRPVGVRQVQEVTGSLLELRQMLNSQVESSASSMHTLADSSGTIATTDTKMKSIGEDLKTSGRLLAKYEKREWTGKVLIAAALVLFYGVVLYILQKRLLGWIW